MPIIRDPETGGELEITQTQYDLMKQFKDLATPDAKAEGRVLVLGTAGAGMQINSLIDLLPLFNNPTMFSNGETHSNQEVQAAAGSAGDHTADARVHSDQPGHDGLQFQAIAPREPYWTQLQLPFPMEEGYDAVRFQSDCPLGSYGGSL